MRFASTAWRLAGWRETFVASIVCGHGDIESLFDPGVFSRVVLVR